MDNTAQPDEPRRCPWCSALASPAATHCLACGAALAQRETIADLVIPGVTTVDPALQAYDAQPLRIPRGSPSQGMAGGAILAAASGGPLGLAALGGLAAVAAAEYAGALGDGAERVDPENVGKPSEAALQVVERLEREEAAKAEAAGGDRGSKPTTPGGAAGRSGGT